MTIDEKKFVSFPIQFKSKTFWNCLDSILKNYDALSLTINLTNSDRIDRNKVQKYFPIRMNRVIEQVLKTETREDKSFRSINSFNEKSLNPIINQNETMIQKKWIKDLFALLSHR